jgi:hypothetical protein
MCYLPVQATGQGVDGRRINTKEIRVVQKCFRREPEINQDIARLVAASRLDLHRKTEFADQRSARRLVAETPAKMLDIEARQLSARSDSELIAVDHDPNGHAVELRR